MRRNSRVPEGFHHHGQCCLWNFSHQASAKHTERERERKKEGQIWHFIRHIDVCQNYCVNSHPVLTWSDTTTFPAKSNLHFHNENDNAARHSSTQSENIWCLNATKSRKSGQHFLTWSIISFSHGQAYLLLTKLYTHTNVCSYSLKRQW